MLYWPAKAPGAALVYEFDWSDGLPVGQALASAAVTATGVTIDAQSFDAPTGKVTVKLSAGTLGTPGIVTCSITTNGSPAQTDSETAILPIGEEPVTLAMAKAQVVYEEYDSATEAHLLLLIQAAREHVEKYTGTALLPAAVTMTFDRFESMSRLTRAPWLPAASKEGPAAGEDAAMALPSVVASNATGSLACARLDGAQTTPAPGSASTMVGPDSLLVRRLNRQRTWPHRSP